MVRYVRDIVASGAIGEVASTTLVASPGAWGATVEPRMIYGLDRANGVSMLTILVYTLLGLAMVIASPAGRSRNLALAGGVAAQTPAGRRWRDTERRQSTCRLRQYPPALRGFTARHVPDFVGGSCARILVFMRTRLSVVSKTFSRNVIEQRKVIVCCGFAGRWQRRV